MSLLLTKRLLYHIMNIDKSNFMEMVIICQELKNLDLKCQMLGE